MSTTKKAWVYYYDDRSLSWPLTNEQYCELLEPKKGDSNMSTFEYEIFVPEQKVVGNVQGKPVTEGIAGVLKVGEKECRISATGVLPKPTERELFRKHAEEITSWGVDDSEVVCNIRPFCG